MKWDSTTGDILVCGKSTKGSFAIINELRGSRIRNICCGKNQILILKDNWEFWWYIEETKKESIKNTLEDVKIQDVAISNHSIMALSLDGQIYSWGESSSGEMGLGPCISKSTTPKLINRKDLVFLEIACGGSHSAGLTSAGYLYTWGRGFEGQTGHGLVNLSIPEIESMFGNVPMPKFVGALTGKIIKTVACGENFTTLLTESGEIWGFGETQSGQLGQGRGTKEMIPKLTIKHGEDGSAFTSITCGWAHVLAMTSTGQIYSWGFNVYGQLGLGDTKTRFYPQLLQSLKFRQLFAGPSYSAGITGSGDLYTWGNGTFGKLGHGGESCELTPRKVDSLRNIYISFLKCSSDEIIVFSPTWITSIEPTSGPISGNTSITISGSGFWDTDDLTIRFAPTTEGRLPRGALGSFNKEAGQISCVTPKFAVAGDVYVEVSMNGKIFTTNKRVFNVYNHPTVINLSPEEGTLNGQFDVILLVQGKIEATNPKIRFITDDEVKIDVNGTMHFITQNFSETSDESEIVYTQIICTAPSFSQDSIVTCRVELALNGVEFKKVDISKVNSKPSDSKIIFHQSEITSTSPNSFSFDPIDDPIVLHGKQLFNIGQTSIKLIVDKLTGEEYGENHYAYTYLTISEQNSSTISCKIPPFAKWKIGGLQEQEEESDYYTEWWTGSIQIKAQILVSLNGEKSYLPFCPHEMGFIHFITPIDIIAISPKHIPKEGGAEVSISMNSFSFFASRPLAKIVYPSSEEVVISARCQELSSKDGEENSTTKEILFKFPAMIEIPKDDDLGGESKDNAKDQKNNEELEDENNDPKKIWRAQVYISLGGKNYSSNFVEVEYYDTPIISSMEPVEGAMGTEVTLNGQNIFDTGLVSVRIVSQKESKKEILQATVLTGDDLSGSITFTIPELSEDFEGMNYIEMALNGHQYLRVDENGGMFKYIIERD